MTQLETNAAALLNTGKEYSNFSIYKEKSSIQFLLEKLDDLQKEAFLLSKSNRSQSNVKYSEAQEVLLEIASFGLSETGAY